MSRSTREALQLYVAILNERRLDEAPTLIAEDFVSHLRIGDVAGLEGFHAMMSEFFFAFPDVKFIIDESLVSEDRGVLRFHWVAPHRQAWLGIPPTDRMIRGEGVEILHVRDGLIHEIWNFADLLGLAAQMGARGHDLLALRF